MTLQTSRWVAPHWFYTHVPVLFFLPVNFCTATYYTILCIQISSATMASFFICCNNIEEIINITINNIYITWWLPVQIYESTLDDILNLRFNLGTQALYIPNNIVRAESNLLCIPQAHFSPQHNNGDIYIHRLSREQLRNIISRVTIVYTWKFIPFPLVPPLGSCRW